MSQHTQAALMSALIVIGLASVKTGRSLVDQNRALAGRLPGSPVLRPQARRGKTVGIKLSDRLLRECQFVIRELGKGTICKKCWATLDTFADQCTADLAEPCPGFISIEEAKEKFSWEWRRTGK